MSLRPQTRPINFLTSFSGRPVTLSGKRQEGITISIHGRATRIRWWIRLVFCGLVLRRPFELAASTESSGPNTPTESAQADLLSAQDAGSTTTSANVSRTGSILNLTSSTLYGIYQPTAFDGSRDESSPWGTEVNTPAAEFPPEFSQAAALNSAIHPRPLAVQRTRSRLSHGLVRGVILPQLLSSALLFGFGIVYGVITVHLHDNHWITPVKLENVHYYDSWQYLGFWGISGITLGHILPWLDSWRERESVREEQVKHARSETRMRTRTAPCRRLPWESTTQASLTLALANPVLWYLIDRTQTGFVLATTPELIPTSTGPSVGAAILNGTGLENALGAEVTQESIAVRTWVASVIFCACVCFGNVGRQLVIGAQHRAGVRA
ncbi:Insulin-induced protein family [Penicillium chermesinum]|nr:Insulin-induced protein family [Penicillium chermesinum]